MEPFNIDQYIMPVIIVSIIVIIVIVILLKIKDII